MPDLAMQSVILSLNGIRRLTSSIDECRFSSESLINLIMLRENHLLLVLLSLGFRLGISKLWRLSKFSASSARCLDWRQTLRIINGYKIKVLKISWGKIAPYNAGHKQEKFLCFVSMIFHHLLIRQQYHFQIFADEVCCLPELLGCRIFLC